jgi:hypothetical protein
MPATDIDPLHALCDVLRQVARRSADLLEHPRADRKIADQLDVRASPLPHGFNQAAPHEPPHREVDVQTVPAGMPLGNPQVRKCTFARARRAASSCDRTRSGSPSSTRGARSEGRKQPPPSPACG